jgi:hypothetical protein
MWRGVRREFLSAYSRGLPEFLIEGNEFGSELPRKPEVTGVIGSKARRQRNLENGGVFDCDLLDSEPIAQFERGKKRATLIGVAPALGDANICEFEAKQAWRYKARAIEQASHILCFRFTEQEGGQSRSVYDPNGGHGRSGAERPLR